MLVQFASDLHLEFAQNKAFILANPLQVKGDVLILAGDIVPFPLIDKHKDFFNYLSDSFEFVWWVPGNHEYYNAELTDKCWSFQESICSNVFLMNNVSVSHRNVRLIFSTLWSTISASNQWQIEQGMGDFRVIKFNGKRFSTDNFNQLYNDSLSFVSKELEKYKDEKSIVTTHHVPTFLNYPEEYKADILNEAFASELYELIEKSGPDFWIYGHHHRNISDFQIGRTSLKTNQLGYVKYSEHLLFDHSKVFEL